MGQSICPFLEIGVPMVNGQIVSRGFSPCFPFSLVSVGRATMQPKVEYTIRRVAALVLRPYLKLPFGKFYTVACHYPIGIMFVTFDRSCVTRM